MLSTYRERNKIQGTKVLENVGIPGLLEQLFTEISSSFPDAHFLKDEESAATDRYLVGPEGTVITGIGWNYREEVDKKSSIHDELRVYGLPVTQALVIEGRNVEVLSKDVWTSFDGLRFVEDALVEAYKNPGLWGEYPIDIG